MLVYRPDPRQPISVEPDTLRAVKDLLCETFWYYKADYDRPIPHSTVFSYVCYAGHILGPGSKYTGILVDDYQLAIVPETAEIWVYQHWTDPVLMRIPITDPDFDLILARTLERWKTKGTHDNG